MKREEGRIEEKNRKKRIGRKSLSKCSESQNIGIIRKEKGRNMGST